MVFENVKNARGIHKKLTNWNQYSLRDNEPKPRTWNKIQTNKLVYLSRIKYYWINIIKYKSWEIRRWLLKGVRWNRTWRVQILLGNRRTQLLYEKYTKTESCLPTCRKYVLILVSSSPLVQDDAIIVILKPEDIQSVSRKLFI